MDQTLLWLHPVMQVFALLLGIFAMWQGMQRVAMNHFKKKIIFQWKSHVRWGSLAMILWIAGAFGFYVTHAVFGETHITGIHAVLAWWIIALCVAGLLTGAVMDQRKKKRFWLPVVHGGLNVLLLVLVLFECYTGYQISGSFL